MGQPLSSPEIRHPLERDIVDRKIDDIIEYLRESQDELGEFQTVRYFHETVASYAQPTRHDGWFAFGRCPFVTATIAYHLAELSDSRAVQVRQRACDFLAGTYEHGVVRYVPARYQDIWFPADIDDSCLTAKVLQSNGYPKQLDEEAILCNSDGQGALYTWLMPRWRQLRRPSRFAWLVSDYLKYAYRLMRQDSSDGVRLLKEYRAAKEPAVLANVLLYFGKDARTRRFVDPLTRFVTDDAPRLEYYDSLVGLHFHVGRLFAAGETSLASIGPRAHEYIRERQQPSGCVRNAFDTAMSALTLMYFNYWECPSLMSAMHYLIHDEMHRAGWLPFPYINPVNRAFSDGSAALTAALHLDALHRYRARM